MDNIGLFIFLGIVVVFVLYFIGIYNNLVRIKHNVSQAWSNIDILLKQRHDELPKLVEVCKQYMQYEGSALEKIIAARSGVSNAREAGDIGALGMAEGQLRLGLGSLFAVSEDYPELKANENFQHLQGRISGLEDAIADRREFYNDSVNINNVRIEQFPDLIIARFLNFKQRELLEFDEAEIQDVDMNSLFN
ncbi:MAG: LemA family protein [gamma proteobacterium symbiont of Taylorina sp.]|nr:LemA family protein [gamma proteobacterium symbiont of Taylorina sp.]